MKSKVARAEFKASDEICAVGIAETDYSELDSELFADAATTTHDEKGQAAERCVNPGPQTFAFLVFGQMQTLEFWNL